MVEFCCSTRDSEGNLIELSGESVEQLAEELQSYGDGSLSAKVYDSHGFVRGWIQGNGDWRAQ